MWQPPGDPARASKHCPDEHESAELHKRRNHEVNGGADKDAVTVSNTLDEKRQRSLANESETSVFPSTSLRSGVARRRRHYRSDPGFRHVYDTYFLVSTQ